MSELSLAEYYNRLSTLDFHYGYADDPKAFRDGSNAYRAAQMVAEKGDDYRKIWRAFNDAATGQREHPKPTEFGL